MNGCCPMSNDCFCIQWKDHMVLPFLLIMWSIMLINLWILNHPCISELNFTWLSEWLLLNILFGFILQVFLFGWFFSTYAFVFIRDIGLQFSLSFVVSLFRLDIMVIWPHRMKLEGFLLLPFVGIVWEEKVLTLP